MIIFMNVEVSLVLSQFHKLQESENKVLSKMGGHKYEVNDTKRNFMIYTIHSVSLGK